VKKTKEVQLPTTSEPTLDKPVVNNRSKPASKQASLIGAGVRKRTKTSSDGDDKTADCQTARDAGIKIPRLNTNKEKAPASKKPLVCGYDLSSSTDSDTD